MKRFSFCLFFWIMSCGYQPVFGQEKIRNPVIIIDPGHGGHDSGAKGTGITEKDIVLEIALEVVRLNGTHFESDLNIYLTRYSDTLISLKDRTKLAKALEADIFISLHCNQAENPKAKGTEVYVSNVDGRFLRQSILAGYHIEKSLISKVGFQSRGVKFGNFQVLKEAVDYFPAVLVELGFLSNSDERNYYKHKISHKRISQTILEAIAKNSR